MSISSINSGYQLIHKSQQISEEAANEISENTLQKPLEFNKIDYSKEEMSSKSSTLDPIVKLQTAKTYNQAGTSLIQRSNDIIGTMLDTHV